MREGMDDRGGMGYVYAQISFWGLSPCNMLDEAGSDIATVTTAITLDMHDFYNRVTMEKFDDDCAEEYAGFVPDCHRCCGS